MAKFFSPVLMNASKSPTPSLYLYKFSSFALESIRAASKKILQMMFVCLKVKEIKEIKAEITDVKK